MKTKQNKETIEILYDCKRHLELKNAEKAMPTKISMYVFEMKEQKMNTPTNNFPEQLVPIKFHSLDELFYDYKTVTKTEMNVSLNN